MPSRRQIDSTGFSADVLEFIRLLGQHEVRYMIVGGQAVAFHGYPRLTGDIDFFYDRAEPNAVRLFACLLEFWAGQIPAGITVPDLMEQSAVIQFGRQPNRLDLLGSIDAVDFSQAWDSRETVEITETNPPVILNYLSKAALLQNKRATGRPRDIDDVQHLDKN